MEYTITDIKRKTARSKIVIIYLNDMEAFSIHLRDWEKLHKNIKDTLSDNDIDYINVNILFPNAYNKCLVLVAGKQLTILECKNKLKKELYPKTVIDSVIDKLTKDKFLDDYRYAESYIYYQSDYKSRLIIEKTLTEKGISKDTIDKAFSLYEQDNPDKDYELCMKLLESKYDKNLFNQYDVNDSYESKQNKNKIIMKATATLARKGFKYDLIRRCLDDYFE